MASSFAAIKQNMTGVILAGGLGRRMSADGTGINKAMVPFRGRPLIAHVIARIRPQVAKLLINADPGDSNWRPFALPVVADQILERPGPLAGVHAALRAIQSEWLVCVPCDTPLLPDDLVARLAAVQATVDADRVSVRCGSQAHPVIALLHSSLADELEQYLSAGGRRIETWLSQGRWAEAHFDDEAAFVNLNTAHDLRHLEGTS